MAIKLQEKNGAVDLTHKMFKGDDGGYYIPSIDKEGNLTWTPSEEDMEAVKGANIKGEQGEKGEDGKPGVDGKNTVWIGDEEPSKEYDVWIAPGGSASNVVTYEQMEEYVAEHASGDLSNYYNKQEVDDKIADIELTPGPKGDKGDPGADGADGQPGADGHTPVKGTDYWTEEDKSEIVSDVLAALPQAEEVEV